MSSITRLAELKAAGEPIVMVTAYDYPSARLADAAGVDVVLVGDSAGMTVLGYDSTVPVTMDELLMLAAAVRRGTRNAVLVGDLPFGSYERSDEHAIENAQRLVKEAGCDAVKLEGGGTSAERARAVVAAGIPVMGHVGLTPQTAAQTGGFRARGRSAVDALGILGEARGLQVAGCFSVVFEAVPSDVTALLVPELSIPVIGIGAGPATDGQVLVWHDLLGFGTGPKPRFVRTYADVPATILDALGRYAADVRARTYPSPEHTYPIDAAELAALRRQLTDGPSE